MSGTSAISWTAMTWNLTTGCTHVTAGCKHCGAFSLPIPAQDARTFSEHQSLPEHLEWPLNWKKPLVIFVNPVVQCIDLISQTRTDLVQVLTDFHTWSETRLNGESSYEPSLFMLYLQVWQYDFAQQLGPLTKHLYPILPPVVGTKANACLVVQLELSIRQAHTLLVDVRLRLATRWAHEWNKAALTSCYGERCRWEPRLGNLHYKSRDLPIALAPGHEDAIAELAALVLSGRSLVLLCACGDAQACHRMTVVKLLQDALPMPAACWEVCA